MVSPDLIAIANMATCTAPVVRDEAEHFYVCEDCGQAVDMRRLGDVFHHEVPNHQRIGEVQ